MSTTLEDLKEDKADLEGHIREEIQAFQKEHGVSVDSIRIRSADTPGLIPHVESIRVEISL